MIDWKNKKNFVTVVNDAKYYLPKDLVNAEIAFRPVEDTIRSTNTQRTASQLIANMNEDSQSVETMSKHELPTEILEDF